MYIYIKIDVKNIFYLKLWLSADADNIEGPVLHVALDGGIVEVATNQPLCIEDCIAGVDGDLVLGWVSDQPLGVGKGYIGRCGAVSLIVGDNFHLKINS